MPEPPYTIFEIQPEWVLESEALGSKEKFWYRAKDGEPEFVATVSVFLTVGSSLKMRGRGANLPTCPTFIGCALPTAFSSFA